MKIIKLINSFENDLKTLFKEQNYKFYKIVSLIKQIKNWGLLKKTKLDQIINMNFSIILTEEEWDKLDTNNLCIKIADDLSSIKLDKNLNKEERIIYKQLFVPKRS